MGFCKSTALSLRRNHRVQGAVASGCLASSSGPLPRAAMPHEHAAAHRLHPAKPVSSALRLTSFVYQRPSSQASGLAWSQSHFDV